LIDTAERWQELTSHASQFPGLQHIWLAEGAAPSSGSTAHPRVSMMAAVVPRHAGPFEVASADPKGAATIIYTSGTTGRPKGVVLSHFALLWNAEAGAMFVPPRADDLFLSVLPLAHAFERTIGYYLPMMGGSTVAYARSVQDLREDLRSIRPTALLAVPRLFERIHAAVLSRAEKSPLRHFLLDLTVSLGWRQFEARQGRGPALGAWAAMAWRLLDRLVAARVRAAFGGRLRVAVSGGATLPENVARFLIGLGIPVVEGYGLTEAGPVVTTSSLKDNLPGSVGRPLHGLEVKLAANGELLVRSPAVMSGYWKDEAATSRAIDQDGWLSTGDVAEIKDGRVFIRGRLKEIIVLSTGENVNPAMLERELEKDTLIKQAMVVGDNKPFVAAVLVLDEENWKALAVANNMDPSLPNAEPASAMIGNRVNERLKDMPRYAQVRAVHATLDPWTIDAGQLTPTLKIKRKALEAAFADDIRALYTGSRLKIR
jgi:long-chain acyl-CoA synthetase